MFPRTAIYVGETNAESIEVTTLRYDGQKWFARAHVGVHEYVNASGDTIELALKALVVAVNALRKRSCP